MDVLALPTISLSVVALMKFQNIFTCLIILFLNNKLILQKSAPDNGMISKAYLTLSCFSWKSSNRSSDEWNGLQKTQRSSWEFNLTTFEKLDHAIWCILWYEKPHLVLSCISRIYGSTNYRVKVGMLTLYNYKLVKSLFSSSSLLASANLILNSIKIRILISNYSLII